MNILVTGSSGFIGKHLYTDLKRSGYNVIPTDIHKDASQDTVVLDLVDSRGVENIFNKNKIDAVIHLAAYVPSKFNNRECSKAFITNITSTQNLLESFSKTKAIKFVNISSIGVYGIVSQKTVTEKTIPNPGNLYCISKLITEKLCQQYSNQHKKYITSLRIAAPYGPGQSKNTVVSGFIKNAQEGKNIEIFGKGERRQNFIYISDIIDAIKCALNYNGSGIYNIGSKKSYSTLELAQIVQKIVSNNKSKIVYTKENDLQESYQINLDITKAKKELSFTPTYSLRQGVAEYIKHI